MGFRGEIMQYIGGKLRSLENWQSRPKLCQFQIENSLRGLGLGRKLREVMNFQEKKCKILYFRYKNFVRSSELVGEVETSEVFFSGQNGKGQLG